MSVPNTPTSLTVTYNSGPQNFSVSWVASTTPPDVTYYNLYVNDVPINVGSTTSTVYAVTVANSGTLNFKVTAVNGVGESAPTPIETRTAFYAPLQVLNQNRTQLGQILRASWQVPQGVTSRVFYYRIETYNVNGPQPWPILQTKDISGANVTSSDYTLTQNGTYAFGIYASYDGILYGPVQVTLVVNITGSNQIPTAPTSVSITGQAGTYTGGVPGVNVSLDWPDIFGATSYKIYLDSSSNLVSTVTPSNAVINITSEGPHTFYVRGTNAIGDGPLTTTSATIYLPYSPPTHFTATPSNGQVAFTWVAPSYQPQPITSYKLDLSGGGTTTTYTISSSATSYTITGLTNNIYYTAGIYAYNASVPGTTTTVPQFKPSASVVLPSQVSSITTYGPSNGLGAEFDGTNVSTRLFIQWPAAANATSYNIYVDGIYRQNFVGTQYNQFTTTTPGTYTISVRSYNSFGEGPRRDYTAVIYLPSSSPTNLSLTAGNTSLIFTWQPPAIITREFSAYRLFLFLSTGGAPLIDTQVGRYETSYVFTGLNIGTQYRTLIYVIDPLINGAQVTSANVAPSGTGTTTPPNTPGSMTATEQGAVIFNSALSTYYKFLWPATANSTFYRIFKKDTPYLTTTDTSGTIIYSGDYTDPYAKIQAANSAGYSGFNQANITVLAPFSAASAVSATPGDASALISWTAPATQPRAIAAYQILLYLQGTNTIGKSVITPTAATSYNITDISNGTAYEAVVRVYEANYVNLLSERSSPFSPQQSVSAPVISSFTTTSVNGTPPVTRVSISYSAVNAATYKRYVNDVLIDVSSSTTFTYDVSTDGVYAFKLIGVSAAAVESDPTIRTETVYAPFSAATFDVITPGFSSINVEWIQPSTRPRTITGYTLTATGGGQTYTYTTTDPLLYLTKLTGLTNGTSYSITIATNPGPSIIGNSPGSYTPSSGAISAGETAILADLSGTPTPAAGQSTQLAGGITSPFTGQDAIPTNIIAPALDGSPVQVDISGFPDVFITPQAGVAKVLFAYENQTSFNLPFIQDTVAGSTISGIQTPVESYDIFTITSCDAAGQQVTGGNTVLDLTDYTVHYTNPVLCHVNSSGVIDVVYQPTSGSIFTVRENPTFILLEGAEQGGAPIVNDEAQCPCAVRGYTLNLSTDRTQTTETVNRSNSVLASSYVSNPQLYKRMDYSTLLRIKMGFAGRGH